jgi:hypothetical protein
MCASSWTASSPINMTATCNTTDYPAPVQGSPYTATKLVGSSTGNFYYDTVSIPFVSGTIYQICASTYSPNNIPVFFGLQTTGGGVTVTNSGGWSSNCGFSSGSNSNPFVFLINTSQPGAIYVYISGVALASSPSAGILATTTPVTVPYLGNIGIQSPLTLGTTGAGAATLSAAGLLTIPTPVQISGTPSAGDCTYWSSPSFVGDTGSPCAPAISLTTIGSSGAATLISNVLNIPTPPAATVTASGPTVGQAACIKAAGPPVVIGYCSTVVGAGGTCTCN